MKTAEQLLREQEVHQIYISGVVYEMVKLHQAVKATEKFAQQIIDCEHEAESDGKFWVCKKCKTKLSE